MTPMPRLTTSACVLFATLLIAASASAMIATDSLRRVVQAELPQIRGCYVDGLRTSPGLAGRMVVRFTVAADGTVSAASVTSSTLASPSVEACVLGRFRALRFPAYDHGETISVSYPLVFSP
jgi:TonB family protein